MYTKISEYLQKHNMMRASSDLHALQVLHDGGDTYLASIVDCQDEVIYQGEGATFDAAMANLNALL